MRYTTITLLLPLLLGPMACSDSSSTNEAKPKPIYHQEISTLNEAKKIQNIANDTLKTRGELPEE